MRTLIVAPNWIGDLIMAQPLFAAIKRADPSGTITVLAPAWVADVARAMPEAGSVIATDFRHGKLHAGTRWRLARDLRRERYDRVYILPNSLKSALVPWLARIPVRIGYKGEARYLFVNRRLRNPSPTVPMVARYLALGPNATVVSGAEPALKLEIDVAERERALLTFGIDAARPLLALCPGAEYGPSKRWPTAHFADVARRAAVLDPSVQVLVLGGPSDRPLGAEIAAAAPQVHDLCGRTTLAEVMALLAAADAVVSNDSGLMHVAAALKRPQVAIYGSSDPRHTPPLSTRARVLWLHTECSPCFERDCPLGHTRCLKELTPEFVMEAILQVQLARPG